MSKNQTTGELLMVRPANFGYNQETAANNYFQSEEGSVSPTEIKERALQEFDNFVALLRSKDINVLVLEDSEEPVKTDAVFPNNWISFHADGKMITYPMFAPSRRKERDESFIERIQYEFEVSQHLRLEQSEESDRFLEGTGSMVLDRGHKIAYACISPRTHPVMLETFCQLTGYEKQLFHATDQQGRDIYHTNVMMAMGADFVVICMDSIEDEEEKAALKATFERTGKAIVEISHEQVNAFAGNMLQVSNVNGKRYLVMSQAARDILNKKQVEQLKKYTLLLSAPLDTIETYGGGSARCMMAEIFLPKR